MLFAAIGIEAARRNMPWIPASVEDWCSASFWSDATKLDYVRAAILQLSDQESDAVMRSFSTKMHSTTEATVVAAAVRKARGDSEASRQIHGTGGPGHAASLGERLESHGLA